MQSDGRRLIPSLDGFSSLIFSFFGRFASLLVALSVSQDQKKKKKKKKKKPSNVCASHLALYEQLWMCNATLILAGIALLIRSSRLFAMCTAAVALAHLAWCVALTLCLSIYLTS
jgi:hypothetical protein